MQTEYKTQPGCADLRYIAISEKIQGRDILGTEYVLKDDSSFIFKRSGDVTSCKQSNIISETDS